MWKFISGALGAVLIVVVTFVVAQQIKLPGGSSSTTTAPATTAPPTTAAPTSAASGATTTTVPKASEAASSAAAYDLLANIKRAEYAAIPADQVEARAAKMAEITNLNGLYIQSSAEVMAEASASKGISMKALMIQFGMMMLTSAIVIGVMVFVFRWMQKRSASSPSAPSAAPRRQPAPKPPVAPVPPTPPAPAAPKHRRSASTPAPWPDERAFEAWFYDQPTEVQPLLKKERMSWPPGQETERWVALRAAMAAQAASTA